MQGNPPYYTVTAVDEIFSSDELCVRRFTLAPGESIPWHVHPSTHDDYYVLAGTLAISLRKPDETHSLGVGGTFRIERGRPHQNANAGEDTCVFLLMQGPGPSTFIPLGG